MLRRVAWRVDGPNAHRADVQVGARLELVNVRACLCGKLAAPGNVVVVKVRVECMRELEIEVRGELQIAVDVA